ncbi:GroES-like protein [Hortaea werneckii]|nr:GroES-like protein [Hortaea werneckii]KAI6885381.1 GroES-like protein [Hortaea werneckii]KAI6995438.1 GroES-like protein [Hortaea werneckii]KAI7146817.1 GroES-like protein [Hortaea werneckii]KAI7175879.1 GroES-like protein [Hortaea werneckii]
MGNLDMNPSFVLRAVQDVAFEDRPVPKLRDAYDVRVHVGQTGICGSDVHYWQRGRIGDFVLNSPIILGHESSGTVVECGDKVKNVKVGQRVAIETPPWDGTLAKYYTVASDFVYPIPDHMTLEEGAMVEPTAVAVQISKTAEVKANQTIVVFGCGPIGVLCQAVAKAYGAKKVIGVDVVQSRLDFAKSFGADGTYLPPKPEQGTDPVQHSERVAELIKKEFDLGEGPDVVIEATGAEPCIQAGVNLTKKGGIYCQAGMGKENVVFPITTACIRALTIKGSIRYTTGVYPAAVDLVASGKVDVKRLITNRFKFEEAEKAFELVKSGRSDVLKVVIEGVQS